jgi:hypothetical protein
VHNQGQYIQGNQNNQINQPLQQGTTIVTQNQQNQQIVRQGN